MIDAKRYARLKDKGLVNIETINGVLYLVFKRFSVEDGTEIPPEKQMIELDKIIIKRDEVQLEYEAFVTAVADINNFLTA